MRPSRAYGLHRVASSRHPRGAVSAQRLAGVEIGAQRAMRASEKLAAHVKTHQGELYDANCGACIELAAAVQAEEGVAL